MIAKLAPELGLEACWDMTPRQLHAFDQLRHWRQEEELANLAEAMRMAQHADKDAFAKMIKRMRS